MNKEQMSAKGEQASAMFDKFVAEVKGKWAKLTNDDVLLLKSERDKFFATLKEKHGVARDEAEKFIQHQEKTCGICKDDKAA